MALNPTLLSSRIRAQILARPAIQAIDGAGLTDLCDALAAAVITTLVSDATLIVAAGIPVATAGSPAAQTGATTAPGTGTIT